jgi:histone-lysine N-methyltransferase SETMAR
MPRVHDFVFDLARAGKKFKEIQETVKTVYRDTALKRTAIYRILRDVKAGKPCCDRRHLNAKKTKRTADVIAAVSTAIKEDRRITIRQLALGCGVSSGTISNILHAELGLVKKSARWVPKLLSEDQKKERVRSCNSFIHMLQKKSLSMLDQIVTMDESAVSFHTPETKKQSKQWLKKGSPGPVKAKVHASRSKQMVLVFFDSKGVIYTNYVPRGTSVSANYILEALGRFLVHFRKKRPDMASGEWFFHWDNAPVHTAAIVQEFIARKGIQMIEHPPYSPDLAPADFFLFPKVKNELAGITMNQETFKKTWEGVLRTIATADFAAAFRSWYRRCSKCIELHGDYVEKS